MALLGQLSILLAFLLSALFLAVPPALAADDESVLISEIGRQNNQSLLWGPYRPSLYFGVRPRMPESLMTGLLWGKIDTYDNFLNSKSPQTTTARCRFEPLSPETDLMR